MLWTSGDLFARPASLVLIVALLVGGAARAIDKTWNKGSASWTVVGDRTPSGMPSGGDRLLAIWTSRGATDRMTSLAVGLTVVASAVE